MKCGMCVAFAAVALAIASRGSIAQARMSVYDDVPEDNPRGNVHLGTPIVIPLNPAARAVHLGWGFNVGGGYNFTRQHGLVGDFTWNDLLPTNEALAKLRVALGDPSLHASVNTTSLSGNYRYELRGRNLGTYFIGGAGLFYRHTSISKEVITGSTTQCEPGFIWWGLNCTSGTVTENQTVGSWSATGPGYNGGVGFTFRVGEPPYRVYAESRYYYAPNSRINTQLINISFGIRY
jgi:hypothetical protein